MYVSNVSNVSNVSIDLLMDMYLAAKERYGTSGSGTARLASKN